MIQVNFVHPILIFKDVRRKQEFGDSLRLGSEVYMH